MVDPASFIERERARRSRPLLRTTLGKLLRRARLDQGRTLADVARAARVSMPYLSELERGRKEASSEILAAVCDALGVDLADLLAAAGRETAFRRGRQPAAVASPAFIRLGSAGDGLAPPQLPGAGEITPAAEPGPEGSAIRRPGDASCLLAA
jgi:XRE family transcriptional regulator, stress-response regulator